MKGIQKCAVFIIILFIVIFASYGYAALNTSLSISGEAYVRVDESIRITGIKVTSIKNGASETFNSKYSKDTITMGVSLQNNTSQITYEYTVKNETGEDYLIENINVLSNTNNQISYSNTGLVNTVIPKNSEKKFQITFTTTGTLQNISLALEFKFATDKVTPPVITGGSEDWSATNRTISLKNAGTATSGVKNYEYYISNSTSIPGNNVTGTTTGNVVVTTAGVKYVFYRTVSNTGKKSAWSNYQTTKIDGVTPPVITGGKDTWTSGLRVISIQSAGSALSGVKNYEYYVSSTIKDPGNNVTGTIEGTLMYSKEGLNYIYYRTVSNTGKKSVWSNYQTVKIDKAKPTITMLAAGNYEMSNSSTIADSTFGIGGGTTTCVNKTIESDTNISTFKDIKGLGEYTIECTATGNNGKTATLSRTYFMGGTLNADYGLSCKTELGSNQCTKSGTSWTVPSGCVQFGPYFLATKGCYKVTYSGSGFNTNHTYLSYQYSPSIHYKTLSLNITNTKVTYYINASEDMTGRGIEFVLRNSNTTAAKINSVKVESVSTCPAS